MSTEITVRMYRPFLGDCFLLTSRDGDRTAQVLIDCGALQGSTGAADLLRSCVADIQQVTGGRLDLLICTHEHWDHLSGFAQADKLFERFDIGEVWLPWTSDPSDNTACQLTAARDSAVAALTRLAGSTLLAGPVAEPFRAALEGVLATNQLSMDGHDKAAILHWLRDRARVRFQRPGQLLTPDWLVGLRCYVLGPPEDPDHLGQMDPDPHHPETYLVGRGISLHNAVLAAADAAGGDATPEWDETRALSFPFASRHRQSLDTTSAFLDQMYRDVAQDWRRIDSDWLAAAGEAALALERLVNNTSLALAFERCEDGRVLLFPGDAQVGNWLSWDQHDFGTPGPPSTVSKLLARTVFYKVGHHGSHNATLREQGLERMTSPDLVAMIPVDRERARKEQWQMPWTELLDALHQRTRGRVLLADEDPPLECPPEATPALWQDFRARLQVSPHCLSYQLPPAGQS